MVELDLMRDRLVELIFESGILCRRCGDFSRNYCAEYISKYLLENGVIVPPCKVGDTLWIKWGFEETGKKLYPVKVYALRFDTKKNNMRICVEGDFHVSAYGGYFSHHYVGTFSWGSVGKTVFLTKEEAEQAMKGGESDGTTQT